MVVLVVVLIGAIAVVGFSQPQTVRPMLVLSGCSGLLFGLGLLLCATSTPDTGACADHTCFFGPPNPQRVFGFLVCCVALLIFIGGCLMLTPRILRAFMARRHAALEPGWQPDPRLEHSRGVETPRDAGTYEYPERNG